MSKPESTLSSFFFPDPFGTGESVCIQAESQEEALRKLVRERDARHPNTRTIGGAMQNEDM